MTLKYMRPADILDWWEPGDFDMGWLELQEYFLTEDAERTANLHAAILQKGWDLADKTNPIKLGKDGKVKNGHHRLVLAALMNPPFLMVEIEE